jgi:hypothetical protein
MPFKQILRIHMGYFRSKMDEKENKNSQKKKKEKKVIIVCCVVVLFCYNGFKILIVVLVIRGYEMIDVRTLASDVLAHDLD